MNWRDNAACYGHDPEMWTGDDFANYPLHRLMIAEAKAICATCPVQAECLADAFERGEKHTIRGGLTADERDQLRKKASQARRNANRRTTRPSRAKEVMA